MLPLKTRIDVLWPAMVDDVLVIKENQLKNILKVQPNIIVKGLNLNLK